MKSKSKIKIDFNWQGVLELNQGTNNWLFSLKLVNIFISQDLHFCEIL